MIKKLLIIIIKVKKKHTKIVLGEMSKLNSIENMTSKVLINIENIHGDFYMETQ